MQSRRQSDGIIHCICCSIFSSLWKYIEHKARQMQFAEANQQGKTNERKREGEKEDERIFHREEWKQERREKREGR